MIRFDHVTKQYPGRVYALSDVTVEIAGAEFVFVIGPSGAGKTTMLRLVIRDLLPTTGNIHVDNWHVNKLPVPNIHLLRRKVGTVFQDFKLLTDRTVFENVALGLEILGKTDKEISTRVSDVLELVGLFGKKNSFPRELSAGEMQRTGIARAIVGGPSILLADEPTGNLDPETSWGILDILSEINKIGTTVVMATHNANIVNHFKKRTITLHEGKLINDEAHGRYPVKHAKEKHATHS